MEIQDEKAPFNFLLNQSYQKAIDLHTVPI